MDFITVRHSFNLGDVISVLPGLKHLYETTGRKTIFYQVLNFPAHYYSGAEHPIKNEEGQQVSMNEKTLEMLKPLLEKQDYIHEVRVWKGEDVEYDFDISRDRRRIPMPASNIHFWPWFIYPEMSCDLSREWLHFRESNENLSDKILINRTHRYTNAWLNYFFLKKYQEKLVFVGMKEEHEDFCKMWQLEIPLLEVSNFYELGCHINSAKGFIGNQSFMWQIADALKKPRVLEYCSSFPNVHPTGQGGIAILYQEALEYAVEKLING